MQHVICFAVMIVGAGIVGGVIFTIVNRGLMAVGLSVAEDFTEMGGKRLAEKIAPEFLQDEWEHGEDREKGAKSFAVVQGLALATRWLIKCKFCTSEAFVSGVVTGMISGAATYHLKLLRDSDEGFFWKVFVELFGPVTGVVGGALILSLGVAIFRYPLRLLLDLVGLALIVGFFGGLVFLIIKGCSS
jgi:hypothetical protein